MMGLNQQDSITMKNKMNVIQQRFKTQLPFPRGLVTGWDRLLNSWVIRGTRQLQVRLGNYGVAIISFVSQAHFRIARARGDCGYSHLKMTMSTHLLLD